MRAYGSLLVFDKGDDVLALRRDGSTLGARDEETGLELIR